MKDRRTLPFNLSYTHKQKRILLSLLLSVLIIPLLSCDVPQTIDHMRRYRVLFENNHQTFHALPVSSTYLVAKEDIFYKESILHGEYMYSLGMTRGAIKRYPLLIDALSPAFPDYPPWLNIHGDNETIESIAIQSDTLLLCITQATDSSSQQMLRSVNLIDQSKGLAYDIQSKVVFQKIELMELEEQIYLLAFSSQSSKTIYIASYPPIENTLSFSPIATFSDTILCWDHDANELVAHLADQSTHLISFSVSPKNNTMEVQRQQTIPLHIFSRFYSPQILLSSKNGDILLWESTMGGSSWIYNKYSSKNWYTLHLSIHNVTQMSPGSLQTIDPYTDASFLSLVYADGQLEYQLLGTFEMKHDLIEKIQKKEDSSD
jgi:hypothetical protein